MNQTHYAVTLRHFFSRDLVTTIRAVSGITRYDEDTKAWLFPINLKDHFCEAVSTICRREKVTLIDVPPFVNKILVRPTGGKSKTLAVPDFMNEPIKKL